MTARPWPLLVAAATLMQPPVAAEAHVMTIPACGGAAAERMLVPGDPADPAQRRECAKACHAMTDRRGKGNGSKRDCC
ncbi:hypothetical protein EAO27_10990 [Sphingopyxis sp. YF1]|jgi:hypothetical protein|uniref:hypothetical protein n=1 Tax=Sphingopyxis sp. YF1 TaxID=2482763 RepID=UPI001F6032BF|nr:hypothetical protein [Sphingopyxis sp. YF1]UNU43177.1 hypothetical protein EAO27_10990 [Sphingopyxis sp. YF1]